LFRPATGAIRKRTGRQISKSLGGTEARDEREDRGPGAEPELALAKQRQDGALQPGHRADEAVDHDEQGELAPVGAQAQADHVCARGLDYGFRAVNTIDRATARWRSGVRSWRMRSMSCGVNRG
jgi:hypothetical protein